MKKYKYIPAFLLTLLTTIIFNSCQETEYEFGDVIAPSNVALSAEIVGQDTDNPNGDGTGVVNFTATASDAISYKFVYNGAESIAPSGEVTYSFSDIGINTYSVTVIAIGTGGATSSEIIEVDVLASYEAPDDLKEFLYDYVENTETSKEWRIKAETVGHMGVGPVEETSSIWWSAPEFDKAITGMYDDRYVFNSDGTFDINTNNTNDDEAGTIFGQATALDATFGDQGLTANDNGEHENYEKDDYSGDWTLTAPSEQETLTLSNDGFIGFYVGGSGSYSIISRSDTEMLLKTIGDDGNAWFFILTTEEEGASTGVDVVYDTLIWQDEFDADGAVSSDNWFPEIEPPNNGSWWNDEVQHYTDREDNSYVSDGTLKIVAKREDYTFGGSTQPFTSARLSSKGKFDFTYGRVDVRAKLPSGGGTWPAIWMLGSNIDEVGWPACGEIDIMEHVGNSQNTIHNSIHTTSSSGNTINTSSTVIDGVSDDFHIYSVNWSEDEITFLVDDVVTYTYSPIEQTTENWPFTADQYLILNVAMGGVFGGDIDAAFVESTMEIDYIRVYQ